MEEQKNSKGLIVLVIILTILVLGLGGYLVYDKVLSKTIKSDFSQNQNDSTETKAKNNTISSIEDFPNSNDNTVILSGDIFALAKETLTEKEYKEFSEWTNFRNINFELKNNQFSLNCEEYDSIVESICTSKSVNINSKINLSFSDYTDYTGLYLMITNNYYIVQTGNDIGSGNIEIYDKNGALLKTIANIVYNFSYNKKTIQSQIKIVNNRLYFVIDNNCNFSLNFIELNDNNLEINKLDSFKASGQGWC